MSRWSHLRASVSIQELVRLRTAGVVLRNRSIHNASEWMLFHKEFEEWERAVIREMERAGVRASDIRHFQTLDLFTPLVFAHAFDDLHAKDLRELSEKIRRLTEITPRHDRG